MWRVSSSDSTRWVQWEAGRIAAEPAGLLAVVSGGDPVEVAPMTGDWYQPRSASDPVAVFLRARAVVGGGVRVTGQPPRVPVAGGPVVPGVVY